MPGPSRREQLEELLKSAPTDTFLRYGLAMEYLAEGRVDQAVAQFRAVLQADPDYVAAYQQLAPLLVQSGDRTGARAVLLQGAAAAQRKGDRHAAQKMQEQAALLEGV